MDWLLEYSQNHQVLVYVVILGLSIAEGPYLSLLVGVFLKLGYLSFWPAYTILMVGDLLGDVVWYGIGRQYGHRFIRRFGKYFSIEEAEVNKVMQIFHKYKARILFVSKISNGLGFAIVTLMTAGMIKIPFGKYLAINFIGQFVWTGFLLAVGYYLTGAYETVNTVLGKMSIIATGVVVLLAMYGYKKFLTNHARKMKA